METRCDEHCISRGVFLNSAENSKHLGKISSSLQGKSSTPTITRRQLQLRARYCHWLDCSQNNERKNEWMALNAPHKQQTTPLKWPEIKRILTYLDAKNAYHIAILRIHLHFTTSRLLKKIKTVLKKQWVSKHCFFFFGIHQNGVLCTLEDGYDVQQNLRDQHRVRYTVINGPRTQDPVILSEYTNASVLSDPIPCGWKGCSLLMWSELRRKIRGALYQYCITLLDAFFPVPWVRNADRSFSGLSPGNASSFFLDSIHPLIAHQPLLSSLYSMFLHYVLLVGYSVLWIEMCFMKERMYVTPWHVEKLGTEGLFCLPYPSVVDFYGFGLIFVHSDSAAIAK